MARAHKFDLENPAPILDDEDEETLAAIDEGIRDADAGRVVSSERVRENWLAIALKMQRDARSRFSHRTETSAGDSCSARSEKTADVNPSALPPFHPC
jgi:hypothetical protein